MGSPQKQREFFAAHQTKDVTFRIARLKKLNKTIKEASRLPVADQNALAKWLLEELEAEKKWELKFAESENVLDKLADEALKEPHISNTTTL